MGKISGLLHTSSTLITISPQKNFKTPNLPEAKTLYASLIADPKFPTTDLRSQNSLLESYASISTLPDAISFLRHMSKANPSFFPDHSTYHILVRHSCQSPDPTLAPVHLALNLMVSNRTPPDRATADIAIRSLCESSRHELAVQLLKDLSLKHHPPDQFTYNFLVRRLATVWDLPRVRDLVIQMRDSFSLHPNLITYTILIEALFSSRNSREAKEVLQHLVEEGLKPDRFLYNTIMKGYCSMNQGTQAIEIYNRMREEGIEPDLITYNTLIFGLSKAGMVEQARKMLGVMEQRRYVPDAVTYTSLMNGMCRDGNALGALKLLKEMEGKGCSPNECTYNTLLHGMCKWRLLDKGLELYGVMRSRGMKLDTGSYATLVRALCKQSSVAEAYAVFDYAVETQSLKDVIAYSRLEGTLKWVKEAKERGILK